MNDVTFGDISRESLDTSDTVNYQVISKPGIHEEVVRQISASNNEPTWMLELRLEALKRFHEIPMPKW